MNKNLKIFAMLAAAFACLTLTCCHEDPEPDPTPDPNSNQNITNGDAQWVITRLTGTYTDITYEYDAKGRVIRVLDVSPGSATKWCDYQYGQSGIAKNYYSGIYPDKSDLFSEDFVNTIGGLIKEFRHYDTNNQLISMDDDNYSQQWKNGNISICSFLEEINHEDIMQTGKFTYGNPDNINAGCFNALNSMILSDQIEPEAYYPYEYTLGGFYGKLPNELIKAIEWETFYPIDDESAFSHVSYSNVDENGCPGTVVVYSTSGTKSVYRLSWKRI